MGLNEEGTHSICDATRSSVDHRNPCPSLGRRLPYLQSSFLFVYQRHISENEVNRLIGLQDCMSFRQSARGKSCVASVLKNGLSQDPNLSVVFDDQYSRHKRYPYENAAE